MAGGSSNDWDRIRRQVYKRDNWQCQCCGRMGNRKGDAQLHAHHIVERSKGGADELDNLITLCDRCHSNYHDNPYLLEDGPPVTPSLSTRLKDWLTIDVLSIRQEADRTVRRERPGESQQRVEWREEGLDELEKLAEELEESNGSSWFPSSDDDLPPRLYSTKSGGFLLGSSDDAVNDLFNGCPRCREDDLTADWIKWPYRSTARRIRCRSCDCSFEEVRVDRNGRTLVDLERVDSVFDLPVVGSPLRYTLTNPNLCLTEFEKRHGTDCPACSRSQSLQYKMVWRRKDLIPRRKWICHRCGAEFSEAERSS